MQKANYSAQLPRHTISPLLVGINFLPLHYRKLEGQSCKFRYTDCVVLGDLSAFYILKDD